MYCALYKYVLTNRNGAHLAANLLQEAGHGVVHTLEYRERPLGHGLTCLPVVYHWGVRLSSAGLAYKGSFVSQAHTAQRQRYTCKSSYRPLHSSSFHGTNTCECSHLDLGFGAFKKVENLCRSKQDMQSTTLYCSLFGIGFSQYDDLK